MIKEKGMKMEAELRDYNSDVLYANLELLNSKLLDLELVIYKMKTRIDELEAKVR